MNDTTIVLIEVGALLLGMSFLGRLAARVGISPIPLYLIVGLAFGTGGVFPLDASAEFFEIGAEIGVILLLALLGLEYTADELLHGLRKSAPAGMLDGALNAIPGFVFAMVMGWGFVAAIAVAGITWVTSSGVTAKLLRDLGRVTNRETPVILSILVLEDLAMAFYLPTVSAVVIGVSLVQGAVRVAIAVAVVLVILMVALRFGPLISKMFTPDLAEPLLLGVLGLTMLVAGLAEQVSVSAAVGAFLVGIALSGKVAQSAREVLTPLRDLFAAVFFVFFGLATDASELPQVIIPGVILAVITMATKILTGYIAARHDKIGVPGRWRAGIALIPRGEFSIVIAGIAGGTATLLAPLAAVYVFITVIGATLLMRLSDTAWFRRVTTRKPPSKDAARTAV